MKRFLLINLLFIGCRVIFSQDGLISYSPNPVIQGSKIQLIYNHLQPEAKLKGNEKIYFRYSLLNENNFEYESQIVKLNKQDKCFSCILTIPENAMQLTGHFITYSSNTLENKDLDIEIHDIEGENIIRTKYPAYNYRNKWFFYPMLFSEDSLKVVIKTEMEMMKEFEIADPLGTLYSRSYGYLLINEEQKAREAIREMVKRYPNHQLTSQAISSYNYMIYAGNINSSEGAQEIWKFNYDMISRNPEKHYSRNFIRSKDPTDFPTKVIENICEAWFKLEPDNPMPFLCLTSRYYNNQSNYEEVQELCTKGIDLIVNNKFRKYLDIGGKFSERFISTLLHRRAWAKYNTGDYSEALTDIGSARSLAKEEGSFPLLEAKIWLEVDNYMMAEKALLEAVRLGDSEADSLLKDVYTVRNVQFKNYNDYLRSKLSIKSSYMPAIKNESLIYNVKTEFIKPGRRNRSGPCVNINEFSNIIISKEENRSGLADNKESQNNMLNMIGSSSDQDLPDFAPDFEVITLEGERISLKDLRNKIIVLNFWFTRCGPCLAEIPELNNLVETYKKRNVEFIAFSIDKKEVLVEFLKKREFKYCIVPESNKQFKDYLINSMPTHIIITPEGKIHNRLVGSGPERYKAIESQIRLLLMLSESKPSASYISD